MADRSAFTIIIPAHNEAAVIARCLNAINRGRPADSQTEIIIAANACSDDTVAIAKQVAPDCIVIELPVGSKSLAMNAAAKIGTHFPRIFLDADVQCDYPSLLALAETLREPGVMAASPAIRMDLSRTNSLVRAYYRVWLTLPYVRQAMVGSGCYGLSEAGYAQIGDFPAITGDDVWVYTRFPESGRRNVGVDLADNPAFFTVSPPRNLSDQIRVETRRRLGNAEVLRLHPSPHHGKRTNTWRDLAAARAGGASLFDIAVYLSAKAQVHWRARRVQRRNQAIVWERDLAARTAPTT